jgi:hypothetical protein
MRQSFVGLFFVCLIGLSLLSRSVAKPPEKDEDGEGVIPKDDEEGYLDDIEKLYGEEFGTGEWTDEDFLKEEEELFNKEDGDLDLGEFGVEDGEDVDFSELLEEGEEDEDEDEDDEEED